MQEQLPDEILGTLSEKDKSMLKPDNNTDETASPKIDKIDEPSQNQEAVSAVEFRAHHLFSLSQLLFLRVHKSEFAERLYRNLKSAQFKVMARGDGKEFSDHMINAILGMMRNQVGEIKIINSHDIICEKCPQKGGDHCKVFGREYSVDFLSMVDEAIVRNTDGVLEIGKSYPPEYILQNIGVIRRAIRKTLLEIPRLEKS